MSDLRVDLVVPLLRLGAGPFALDPLEHFVGAKLSHLLEPVLAGPIAARRLASGALVEVYPLRLPDGEGASLVLGTFGEIGLANQHGELLITVPRVAGRWIAATLRDAVVDARELPAGLVAFAVRLGPGMRAAFPLGSFGEVAVEIP